MITHQVVISNAHSGTDVAIDFHGTEQLLFVVSNSLSFFLRLFWM